MQYTTIPGTDTRVSKICLGTMTWGQQNDQKDAFEQMDYALAAGVNFIDTAEMYPIPPDVEKAGATETYIGNYFKERKNRDKWVLASKVAGKGAFLRDGGGFLGDNIGKALDASLQRLQTDYIDLYQLHWPQRDVNKFGMLEMRNEWAQQADHISETLEKLGALVKAGKVRHIGLSNETAWGLMKFLSEADKNRHLPRVRTVQNNYSLLNRKDEIGLSEALLREGVGALPYSPLGGGVLSGKYLGGQMPKKSRLALWGAARLMDRYNSPVCQSATEQYKELAKQYGMSAVSLALAFVASQTFVTAVIIGATTLTQLKECISSIDHAPLSTEILAEINKIHLQHPFPSEIF